MRTTIYGTIYDAAGKPYKGAIVKFQPNKSYVSLNELVPGAEIRAVTNAYGRFEVDIPPSADDEDYYFMTVIYEQSNSKAVLIPASTTPVNFLELQRYLYPHERMGKPLGSC